MFMNIISMFEVICLRTLYDIILGYNSYWEAFHIYSLYMDYSTTVLPYVLTCVRPS